MARAFRLVLLGLFVFLPLFGAGCGEASSGDVVVSAVRIDPCLPFALVVDADATSEQRDGARAALDAWSAVADVRGSLAASPDGASADLPLHFQAAAAASHGFFDPARGEVFVNVDLAARPLAVTIAHELGHAFGLAHVADRPSVMNAGNLDLEPSPADAAALAGAWGACASVDPI